ncbi:MAG: hypothetical protein CMK89_16865 [Pseudomonadales bacterium]|jgi:nucleoid DNA-binding protein|nr:hypothetical protein [Pseudomonadales bacterium]RLU02343.1 MAG: hypothetical protein D9N11_09685 [Ketobacter sp.]
MPAKKKAPAKKAAAKKAPAKKVAAKKAPAKKVAAKKAAPVKAAPKKAVTVKEAMTKTQILNTIAENTELSRKQVQAVLDELSTLIEAHVKPRGVGTFTVPGLMKIKTIKKPAQKARKNVPNPFRPGETMDVAAKPASTRVKVLPLKKLKDMAS